MVFVFESFTLLPRLLFRFEHWANIRSFKQWQKGKKDIRRRTVGFKSCCNSTVVIICNCLTLSGGHDDCFVAHIKLLLYLCNEDVELTHEYKWVNRNEKVSGHTVHEAAICWVGWVGYQSGEMRGSTRRKKRRKGATVAWPLMRPEQVFLYIELETTRTCTFTNWDHRKRVRAPQHDIAIKRGVWKGENLLNSCRVRDTEHEYDEGEGWHGHMVRLSKIRGRWRMVSRSSNLKDNRKTYKGNRSSPIYSIDPSKHQWSSSRWGAVRNMCKRSLEPLISADVVWVICRWSAIGIGVWQTGRLDF